MLWGDHGHGGYCTESDGYIQGGQPMDDTLEFIDIYLDFEEAKNTRNWNQMRQAVSALRRLRSETGCSEC